MTIPAMAKELSSRLPSAMERSAANQLRTTIAAQSESGAKLLAPNGAEIVLTPALSTLLLEMLRHIGAGDAVTIVPIGQMLTTQQAADILNVSRPYLISLLDKEIIPYTLVGRHRRIKAENLFAYKHRRDTERKKALSDLAELDSGLI